MSSKKDTLVTQLGPTNVGPTATPYSLTTTFSTQPTVVRFLDNCSYQINVSTTDSVGSFAVEMSNDYFVNPSSDNVVTNPGTWIPLTLTSSGGAIPSVSAVDTNISINLNQLPFYAIRLTYTPTTPGTGTCKIYISDKVLGA